MRKLHFRFLLAGGLMVVGCRLGGDGGGDATVQKDGMTWVERNVLSRSRTCLLYSQVGNAGYLRCSRDLPKYR